MGLLKRKNAAAEDRAARLEKAELAGAELEAATEKVDSQVSFVKRLTAGWREVHETNHLAELFRKEYGGIRE
jgi:hypothetical protein